MNKSASSTIAVRVPFQIRKHGGRKLMVTPDGTADRARPRIDNALVKAVARAFRWKRMLEGGEFATIRELANHEKLASSYMTRVLRLSLLEPDIVEAILNGRQLENSTLDRLLKPFPTEWKRQRAFFAR
jgi:hypothetical protein